MWICQLSAYFKFIPSTHTHRHTHRHTHTLSYTHTHTHTHILISFEDREPTGLKVDIARKIQYTLGQPSKAECACPSGRGVGNSLVHRSPLLKMGVPPPQT